VPSGHCGDQRFVSLATLALLAIGSGTTFYWAVEGLRPVDSLYFSVTTLTTVGYGDFSPQTDAGKLVTVVYVLVGVGILLAFLSMLAGQVVKTHMDGRAQPNGDARTTGDFAGATGTSRRDSRGVTTSNPRRSR
jgi:hypothetical protein